MGEKKTGISRDLIIHPGETIADVLEERGITQAELATRTDVSPAYISSVISGKKDISKKFAMNLEYALGVSKSFWLNLQANYDAELLEFNKSRTITEEEKQACRALAEVVKFLRKRGAIPVAQKVEETVLSLREAFQISNLENLRKLVPQGAFRMDTKTAIEPYVLGAWLRLCQTFGETSSVSNIFCIDQVDELVSEIKNVMTRPNCDLQPELASIMRRYGIVFTVVQNFRGAPVHGYISQQEDGVYQMVLTIRGSFADIFWFSLFHEIGHIVNGDISKGVRFIDVLETLDEEKERAADEFARNVLLDPQSYTRFVHQGDFSINAIRKYAETQNVMPYIVIGRLQREKRIPYSWFSKDKLRYKWA